MLPIYPIAATRFFKQLDKNLALNESAEVIPNHRKETISAMVRKDIERVLSEAPLGSNATFGRNTHFLVRRANLETVEFITRSDVFTALKSIPKSDLISRLQLSSDIVSLAHPYSVIPDHLNPQDDEAECIKYAIEAILYLIYSRNCHDWNRDLFELLNSIPNPDGQITINRSLRRITLGSSRVYSQIFKFIENICTLLDLDNKADQDLLLAVSDVYNLKNGAKVKYFLHEDNNPTFVEMASANLPDELPQGPINLDKLIYLAEYLKVASKKLRDCARGYRLRNHNIYSNPITSKLLAVKTCQFDEDLANNPSIKKLLEYVDSILKMTPTWVDVLSDKPTMTEVYQAKYLVEFAEQAVQYVIQEPNLKDIVPFVNEHFRLSEQYHCLTFHGLPIAEGLLNSSTSLELFKNRIIEITTLSDTRGEYLSYPNFSTFNEGLAQLYTGKPLINLGIINIQAHIYDVFAKGTFEEPVIRIVDQDSNQAFEFTAPEITWPVVANHIINHLTESTATESTATDATATDATSPE